MIDIILGILCFNVILILFKVFERLGVDNLQAILINYLTAGSLGWLLSEKSYSINEIASSDWLLHAIAVGILFITVFTFLAKSAQKVGMAISTVANKMSVVIPVIAAFIIFGDTVNLSKIIGIVLALLGVVLTSTQGKKLNFDVQYVWLILFIFFGQGLADIIFNYAQQRYVGNEDVDIFFAVLFFSAGIGGLILLTSLLIRGKTRIRLKNVIWGILLGIPNYLTLLFFFRSLESGWLESTQVYPIYNIGVVIVSALIGFFAFKEKLEISNWIGIIVSVAAIALISFG